MVTVFYTYFTEPTLNNNYIRLLNSVTPTVLETALRFHKKEDCFRSILGKLLVCHYFRKNKSELLLFEKNSFNRPYVIGGCDFNISHSGNYVICAFSDESRVGVDIEEIVSLNVHDFDHIFHAEELKAIKQSKLPLKLFFDIWVKKEAVTKADGRGLGCELKEIDTLSNPVEYSGIAWNTKLLHINENYAAAIATDSTISVLNVQEIFIDEL